MAWNGEPINVSVRPLCAVLLAMLVLAEPDRRLSRKALAVDLWPDDDETTAAANLRRHLSFLTTSLPAADACIGRDREALWWFGQGASWCDVVEFERGDIEQYGADFMEGFVHEWVIAQRERLRATAVAALVRRAETLRDDDDYAGALANVRRVLDIDPYDEAAAQLEMELLGERGDSAAMDAAYALLARRLGEIDAKPSPETTALVHRFHVLAREASARLPRPVTTFVGASVLDDVAALVPAHRLVTIVGPGGVGKTRVALEVAHRVAATFADGAYFVDLSTVTDGDALPAALSRALGVPTNLASKGLAGVQTFLRNRRALVVLDTCEQLAEPCSRFVSDVLALATHVHVIATTREAFGLRAERLCPLAPLPVEAAVALFADRARNAAWTVDDLTAAAPRIAAICRRLDGLPLALELAASMLGTLSLADLERQLDEDAGDLRSRDTTMPARHRSLAGMIAWSVSLLDDREREAFVRLAVFAGSFTAAAAKAVCGVDIVTLSGLVAKSVLVRENAIDGRFSFLISVGDYARRLASADPRTHEMRNAHAQWFAAIAMRSTERTFWSGERAWLEEIDREYANVVRAMTWSLSESGEPASGFRLAVGLGNYFARRGFLREGLSRIRAAYERTEPESRERAEVAVEIALLEIARGRLAAGLDIARTATPVLERLGLERESARAINVEAALLLHLGRNDEAKPLLERALPLAKRAGDLRSEATIQSNFAFLLSSAQQSEEAREAYVLALRGFNEAGHTGGAARMLNAIAASDFTAGRYDAAIENLERALVLARDIGDLGAEASILSDLGDVAYVRGDDRGAREHYEKALSLCEAHESELPYESVLSGFAATAAGDGRFREAARLLGAARPQGGTTKTQANLHVYERARSLAEEQLGRRECELEMRFGSELSRGEAVKLARSVLEPVFTRPARGR